MNRRYLLKGAAAVALLIPGRSKAQGRSSPRRVGFLAGGIRPEDLGSSLYGGFMKGMSQLGYVEGKDYLIEWRFAEGKYERFPGLAEELVKSGPDVIVTSAMAAVRPIQRATDRVPIVMGNSIDPVGNGLIASLARPGGNTTGLSSNYEEVFPKMVDLLVTTMPGASRIAFFMNPANDLHTTSLKHVEAAAARASVTLLPVRIGKAEDVEGAFQTVRTERAEAIMVPADALFITQRQRLAEQAIKIRVISVFAQREYVAAGGLMSYGENLEDFLRRSASFVDKVFKGARPADLPVEQPTN